jgi:AraC-like DNA-binding protein
MTHTLRGDSQIREYFVVKASAGAVSSALDQADVSIARNDALVLDLARTGRGDAIRVAGRLLSVVPFPCATLCLTSIALDVAAGATSEPEDVEIHVPRDVFDQIADLQGFDRIAHLNLRPGAAAGDLTLSHLAACLRACARRFEAERSKDAPSDDGLATFVDQIVLALHTHLARRFGGMRRPETADRAGLAPWQLRLAKNAIDSHLDEEISLAHLARDCGLSVSHFARGFTRSTGLPPHRWLMQRRVVIATELIRQAHLSLAEIAFTCGFADQSHFTRVFAAATGLAPGKWRDAGAQGAIHDGKASNLRPTGAQDGLEWGVQRRNSTLPPSHAIAGDHYPPRIVTP